MKLDAAAATPANDEMKFGEGTDTVSEDGEGECVVWHEPGNGMMQDRKGHRPSNHRQILQS